MKLCVLLNSDHIIRMLGWRLQQDLGRSAANVPGAPDGASVGAGSFGVGMVGAGSFGACVVGAAVASGGLGA